MSIIEEEILFEKVDKKKARRSANQHGHSHSHAHGSKGHRKTHVVGSHSHSHSHNLHNSPNKESKSFRATSPDLGGL